MNILLGVYACEPHKGSEPEVGWQMVNEIAKVMPNDTIYAITKYNNQILIEKEKYPPNVKFFYFEPPKWLTFWKKGGRGVRTYYYIWSITAAFFIKKQNIKFDIVHHVTFVNDWLPSFLYMLKTETNKFIWGPIGSHAPIESKFLDGLKRQTTESLRIFLQLFFRNIDPFFRQCKEKADCIIGITQNVKKNLHLTDKKCFMAEPAIAIKKTIVLENQTEDKSSEKFIIISVGRLLYIKNFKLTILAFSKFLTQKKFDKNIKLQIIGKGNEKKRLIAYAKSLNILEYVDFLGQIPRDEVQEHFAKANLFLFPTLESAGFVTLEAMSFALPVLAMKYGGPLEFIKHFQREQLVSTQPSFETIATNLAQSLEVFYNDNDLCTKVGKQNRQDVLDNFTWEAKAQKMKKLYKELLNEDKA